METSVAAIFDRAAPTYDRAAFPFFAPFGEALVEFAQLEADERVLDAGCGAGAVLAPAARIAGDVTGIDISAAMIERARTELPGAELTVGDVCALPFEDASFDVVFSAFVVFFPDDPTVALREAARVLRPDGRLVMSTWAPNDPRWAWERQLRMRFADRMDPALIPQIVAGVQRLGRFDDADKVAAELQAGGFEPERIESLAIEFSFADEQEWWDWSLSHAGRVGFEALREDARQEFHERALENVRKRNRAEDGRYPRIYTAIFSSATPVG